MSLSALSLALALQPVLTGQAMNTVQWSVFQAGVNSRQARTTTRVLVNEGDWQTYWKDLTGNDPSTAPRGVNWMREQLVAVTLGERSTAGHAVRIVGIEKQGGDIVVRWCAVAPAPGSVNAQVVTRPWAVARMNRIAGGVKFTEVPAPQLTLPNPGGPIWGGPGYDVAPLPWQWLFSGTTASVPRTAQLCLATPTELDQYWRSLFGRSPENEVTRGLNWRDDLIFCLHGPVSAPGTTVGIDSVLLDRTGSVLVTWYLKAPVAPVQGPSLAPFTLIRLPRYSTNPYFRQSASR